MSSFLWKHTKKARLIRAMDLNGNILLPLSTVPIHTYKHICIHCINYFTPKYFRMHHLRTRTFSYRTTTGLSHRAHQKCRISGSIPDPINENPHFNKIPKRFIYTLKLKKYWSSLHIFSNIPPFACVCVCMSGGKNPIKSHSLNLQSLFGIL